MARLSSYLAHICDDEFWQSWQIESWIRGISHMHKDTEKYPDELQGPSRYGTLVQLCLALYSIESAQEGPVVPKNPDTINEIDSVLLRLILLLVF